MDVETSSLLKIFEGWEGYQASLVSSIAELAPEQLSWRPAPHLRTAGQIAAHISTGRISWFARMGAPGSAELAAEAAAYEWEGAAEDPVELVRWLEASWQLVKNTLQSWTVDDLQKTYRQTHQGREYEVSYQWTIFRILAHDLHHGGELAVSLGMQGVQLPYLGDLGGHLTLPPLVEEG